MSSTGGNALWLIGALVLLIVAPVVGVLWMTAVPGRSHAGPLPPLKPEQVELAARLRNHVQAIASRPHNIGHPQELERAALHIESALAGMGYQVNRQPFRADGQEVRNIEVVVEPAAASNTKTLVVGATMTAISTRQARTITGREWRAWSSLQGSFPICGDGQRSGSDLCCSSTRS